MQHNLYSFLIPRIYLEYKIWCTVCTTGDYRHTFLLAQWNGKVSLTVACANPFFKFLLNMLFKTKFTLISKAFSGSNKYIRYIHLKKKINKIFFPVTTQKSSKEVLSSVLNNYDLTKQHLSYNNIGLLFLTQGLNTNDIKHINLLFNKFQITLTKLPIRVLSKSFFSSRVNLKSFPSNGKKNYIYGEMLLVHPNNSIYGNECLDFIYKQIMYFFLLKTSNIRYQNPSDFYLKLEPFESSANIYLGARLHEISEKLHVTSPILP